MMYSPRGSGGDIVGRGVQNAPRAHGSASSSRCSVSTPVAFGGLAKRLNDIVGEKDVDPEEGPEGEPRDPLDFTELLEK